MVQIIDDTITYCPKCRKDDLDAIEGCYPQYFGNNKHKT